MYISMEMVASRGLLLLSAILFITSTASQAQNNTISLTQPIELPSQSLRLDSLFKFISKTTGLTFTYDASKIKPQRIVKSKKQVITLIELFSILKDQTYIDSKFIDDHIVLFLSPTQAPIEPAVRRASGRNDTLLAKQSVSPKTMTTVQSSIKTSNTIDRKSTDSASFTVAGFTDVSINITRSLNRTPLMQYIDSSMYKVQQVNSGLTQRKAKPKSKTKFKPAMPEMEANFGLSIDESSYLGATLQMGIPFLYGTASWHTNINTAHFRLGAIASFNITSRARIQLSWSTGNLSKQYTVDSTGLSPSYQLSAKSKLDRIGLAVQFPISKSLQLLLGPQLNRLKTSYYINSIPTTLLLIPNAAEVYYTLKAPYTLNKTKFEPPYFYKYTWIGFQIAVLHKIKLRRK